MNVLRWFPLLLAGCNVEAVRGDTGGVGPGEGGPCPDGITVVLSDFLSTQVALSTTDGVTQSESFVSTASVRSDGLSFALSGDVVLPTERPRSGRVVLLDRHGTNVVTFMDPVDGKVLGQLPVGTGFQSNPYDYLEIDEGRAYVARFGNNGISGREPFDQGSDLLIIDTLAPEIVGRVALPSSDDFPAHPSGLIRLDDQHVVVTLQRHAQALGSGAEDSMLAGIDSKTDSIVWQLVLDGLKNCGTARLAPSGRELAVACSGLITRDGETLGLEESGIVVLDTQRSPPVEMRRFGAGDIAGEPLQSEVAFFADGQVLLKTQTARGAGSDNRLIWLDLESGQARTVFTVDPSARGVGIGVTLGAVACAPGCSDYCLVADAAAGALQRLRVSDGRIEHIDSLAVERRVGLPPVGLCYR